jgi:adenine specific DNA methylase Mod
VGKEQETMSEGLKKKIQEKAKTINELEKILYQKSRYTSREFIYEKDKQETWITVDDVTALLDETTKHFPFLKCRKRKSDDADGHCSNQDCEHYRCCNWFLAVLGVDGKEKAKP